MLTTSNRPDYKIIQGSPQWADRCREFCLQAYLDAYLRPELGITEGLFSKEVFSSPRIVKYYQDICQSTPTQTPWLAVNEQGELIGMVVVAVEPKLCQMKAFYVKPELKGQGIGHALYTKVLKAAGDGPIQVDVVEYMQDTINIYEHWGFYIDESKGKLVYPIIEWPEAARKAFQAIYMVKPGGSQ